MTQNHKSYKCNTLLTPLSLSLSPLSLSLSLSLPFFLSLPPYLPPSLSLSFPYSTRSKHWWEYRGFQWSLNNPNLAVVMHVHQSMVTVEFMSQLVMVCANAHNGHTFLWSILCKELRNQNLGKTNNEGKNLDSRIMDSFSTIVSVLNVKM